MNYKAYNFKSFNVYTVNTSKFNNVHVEIIFRKKIDRNTVVLRNALSKIMGMVTKDYQEPNALSKHLEELYNMSYYPGISRVGSCLFTSFNYDFLNSNFIDESYLKEVLDFIIKTIMNPYLTNEKYLKMVKHDLIEEIKMSQDNIKQYAYLKLFSLMDEESSLSINILGTEETIKKIEIKDLLNEYLDMIENDYCDIYIIGNIDSSYIANYFYDHFNLKVIKDYKINILEELKERKKINIVKEQKDIEQVNLLVGCNISKTDNEVLGYVYNTLLGGGSLDAKLAKYLRQNNSLCYTVNSIYQKYDSLIVIYAGIDASNVDKAIKLIKKALKEMKENIKEDELENAKSLLINSLMMVNDNQQSIINNYLFRNIDGLSTVEQRIEMIKNIKIDDVKKMAKSVKINTIYMLGGK